MKASGRELVLPARGRSLLPRCPRPLHTHHLPALTRSHFGQAWLSDLRLHHSVTKELLDYRLQMILTVCVLLCFTKENSDPRKLGELPKATQLVSDRN